VVPVATTARFYKRPTVFRRRVYDPVVRMLILKAGLRKLVDFGGDDFVVVLVVPGRRTGRLYRRPVGVCVVDGRRHIVGFYGQSEWSLNLRAAGGAAEMQTRGRTERITATELTGDEKAEFLRRLVDKYRFFARAWLKVNPRRFTDDDLVALVVKHPVFRVETRNPTERAEST
jgi:deazaflavin-dependent oxidoreductase (nitroreductase family)